MSVSQKYVYVCVSVILCLCVCVCECETDKIPPPTLSKCPATFIDQFFKSVLVLSALFEHLEHDLSDSGLFFFCLF